MPNVSGRVYIILPKAIEISFKFKAKNLQNDKFGCKARFYALQAHVITLYCADKVSENITDRDGIWD